MYLIRQLLLRQVKNGRNQRNLSRFAMKVDDFTLTSSLTSKPTPDVNLFDRFWVHSSCFKDKVALVSAETNKTYTYFQLQKFISVFATSLVKKLGLHSDDIVAVSLPNCPEFPVIAFGAIQAGCIITTINPAYKSYELIHQLTLTKPKVVVTVPQVYNTIVEALNNAKLQAKIVLIDNPSMPVPDEVIRYSEIAEVGKADYGLLDKVEKKPDDVAVLPFSSGTTGLPKGVEITYKNLLSSLEIMLHEANHLATLPNDTHQDIVPCVLPFFHIYGLVVTLLGHLSMGCKLITMSSFQPQVYLNLLKTEKVTLLYTVPSMCKVFVGQLVTFLGKTPTVTKEYLKNLNFIFSGAAPLTASDVEELLEKLHPKTQLLQGYALTETTSMGVWTFKDSFNRNFGSCGDPSMNVELRFADTFTDELVPIGQKGEVLIRTPCLMKGYYKNEKATAECMTDDGFYKTGDLGVYDVDKGLYILDRLKDLIKVKGMQVAPAELESILRSHPSVLDAGVVGIPHAIQGQVPKAFVVLNKAKPATDEELKAFVAEKVVSFKKIHEIVFVDALPKNASGKILRAQLKDM